MKILLLLNIPRNLSQINSHRQHFGSLTQIYQNNLFHTRHMIFSSNNEPQNNQKDTGVCVHPRMKSSHPSLDCLSLSQFHQTPTVHNSTHLHHKNKKAIVWFSFLSHTLNRASVLSVFLWREPPVLCDSRLLLLYIILSLPEGRDTHTHTHRHTHTTGSYHAALDSFRKWV